MKHAPAPGRTPFTELAAQPEKLEAALRAARNENDAFAATRKYGRYATTSHTATGAATRSGGMADASRQSPPEIREVEFQLEAPSATSVMLAASFTAWERFPLGLARMRDGIWSIFVPLLPGIYAYRFLVDGRWCDDPRAGLCMPGLPGGSGPALKVV
jgi:1,4-alpha-glucan branching enzyme